MTTQLIYAVLGGAGFGVFAAAIARWLSGGRGLPKPPPPLPPPEQPDPQLEQQRDPQHDSGSEGEPHTSDKAAAEELAKVEEEIRKQAEHETQRKIIAAKQEALKRRASKIKIPSGPPTAQSKPPAGESRPAGGVAQDAG
ncbi:hypothetical protein [Amycolatopsis sp. cmx-8-4]|uniref:hypothetical protein n=1 Tax=Amycolatopsis sp. cmx-8-4 TaxID=2790947 RepID=UPI00397A5C2F